MHSRHFIPSSQSPANKEHREQALSIWGLTLICGTIPFSVRERKRAAEPTKKSKQGIRTSPWLPRAGWIFSLVEPESQGWFEQTQPSPPRVMGTQGKGFWDSQQPSTEGPVPAFVKNGPTECLQPQGRQAQRSLYLFLWLLLSGILSVSGQL